MQKLDNRFVRQDAAQSLTDPQKAQVHENIGTALEFPFGVIGAVKVTVHFPGGDGFFPNLQPIGTHGHIHYYATNGSSIPLSGESYFRLSHNVLVADSVLQYFENEELVHQWEGGNASLYPSGIGTLTGAGLTTTTATIEAMAVPGVFNGQLASYQKDLSDTSFGRAVWNSTLSWWEPMLDSPDDTYESYWRREIRSRRPDSFHGMGLVEGEFVEFLYARNYGYCAFSFPTQSITAYLEQTVVSPGEDFYYYLPYASGTGPDDLAWGAIKFAPGTLVEVDYENQLSLADSYRLAVIDFHNTPCCKIFSAQRLKCILGLSFVSIKLSDPITPNTSQGNLVLWNTNMDAEDLNHLFRMLPEGASGQIIAIPGNPGANSCNPAIATAKGYEVSTTPIT